MSEASGKDGVDPVANSMGSDPHHGVTPTIPVQYVTVGAPTETSTASTLDSLQNVSAADYLQHSQHQIVNPFARQFLQPEFVGHSYVDPSIYPVPQVHYHYHYDTQGYYYTAALNPPYSNQYHNMGPNQMSLTNNNPQPYGTQGHDQQPSPSVIAPPPPVEFKPNLSVLANTFKSEKPDAEAKPIVSPSLKSITLSQSGQQPAPSKFVESGLRQAGLAEDATSEAELKGKGTDFLRAHATQPKAVKSKPTPMIHPSPHAFFQMPEPCPSPDGSQEFGGIQFPLHPLPQETMKLTTYPGSDTTSRVLNANSPNRQKSNAAKPRKPSKVKGVKNDLSGGALAVTEGSPSGVWISQTHNELCQSPVLAAIKEELTLLSTSRLRPHASAHKILNSSRRNKKDVIEELWDHYEKCHSEALIQANHGGSTTLQIAAQPRSTALSSLIVLQTSAKTSTVQGTTCREAVVASREVMTFPDPQAVQQTPNQPQVSEFKLTPLGQPPDPAENGSSFLSIQRNTSESYQLSQPEGLVTNPAPIQPEQKAIASEQNSIILSGPNWACELGSLSKTNGSMGHMTVDSLGDNSWESRNDKAQPEHQPVQQPKKRRGRPPKVKTATNTDAKKPGPKPKLAAATLKSSPYRRPPVPHRGQPQVVSVSLRLDPTVPQSTPPSP